MVVVGTTRSIGIRLPTELWKLVKAAEPKLTYSEIVKQALLEIYDIEEIDLNGSLLKPEINKEPISIVNIRNVIDNWESSYYGNKDSSEP